MGRNDKELGINNTRIGPLNITKKHAWWNGKFEDVIKRRRNTWKICNSNKSFEKLTIYQNSRKETHRILRRENREFLRNRVTEVEENFKRMI